MKCWSIVLACLPCCVLSAHAESTTETAGTGVAVALPLVAGGITLWKHDWAGSAQLLTTTALTVGTVYGMKQFLHECRPFAKPCSHNSSEWDSFPSDTSALAFAPAQFLWQRYGWKYGLPAYAAATFVGWSRVDTKQHHWWDVATSAAISIGYNEIFTTRFHRNREFQTNLQAAPGRVFASVSYRW